MSFYHVHKNNPRLHASRPSAAMKDPSKLKPRGHSRNAARLLAAAEWDVSKGDCSYEKPVFFMDFNDYDDEEECAPSASTNLTVDLVSLYEQKQMSAVIRRMNREAFEATADHEREPSNTKVVEMPDESLIDPLCHVAWSRPRLVRSKSFTQVSSGRGTITSRRRSHSLCGLRNNASLSGNQQSFATRCIQKLIPADTSMLGPAPHASLVVLSDRCRASVLLLWSTQRLLTVVPLVGCSHEETKLVQSEIRSRLNDIHFDQNKWTVYYSMSCQLVKRLPEWTQVLDSLLDEQPEPLSKWKTLVQSCAKTGMTLGRCYDQYDLLKDRIHNQDLMAGGEKEASVDPSHRKDNNVCLVCFEDIDDSDICSQILPCGHYTCSDCLKRYFKSAANSGQGRIQCSAEKCRMTLGLCDAAHLLCDSQEDEETFSRLVRFELESRQTPRSCRFCPSPNCGRLLQPCAIPSPKDGCNILLCGCGMSLCSDCNMEEWAHPGLSCLAYRQLQQSINSGKLNAELASVTWVIKNTKPCPKCQYPIYKAGGCNHVRCQKCQNYFCWQCGGEGQLCMAFYCKNTNIYWDDDPNFEEGRHRQSYLVKLVEIYRSYRSIEDKLKGLIKTLSAHMDNEDDSDAVQELVLDVQIYQVLLWNYLLRISTIMRDPVGVDTSTNALQLELILHVKELRSIMEQTRIKPSQEALAAVLGLPTKSLSVCKQKAKERRDGMVSNEVPSAFQKIFVDQELEDLCRMDSGHFIRKVKDAIREGVRALQPPTSCSSNSSRRKKNKNCDGPLNQRLNRPNDPWRRGYKRSDDEDSWSDDGNRRKKRSTRWKKSKAQVFARRASALEQSDLMVL